MPSGAILKISLPPFAEAKALYQAVLEEVGNLKLDPKEEVDVNFWKGIFCTGFSSKKIDAALSTCMKRALYNEAKISDETWEPIAAREDYLPACFEVAQEAIQPFMKNLYAKFSQLQGMITVGPS